MTGRLLALADRIAHFAYEPTRLSRDLTVARWHHRLHLVPHRLIEPICDRYDRQITREREGA